MPDQFSREKVYIVSKTERKYDILQKQNCVIIKRRATPAVYPDYIKPRPISPIKKKKEQATQIDNKPAIQNSVQPQHQNIPTPVQEAPNDVSLVSPISNSMSFEELQKKVEKLREQESKKEPAVVTEEDETPIVTMEDADDLANGVIVEEQELINKEYLKSLKSEVLKKVYYVATGKRWNKDISKFEMRKDILSVYKNSNSKRKQIIYESSREAV